MSYPSETDLQGILRMGPQQIQEWLVLVWSGELEVSDNFNWLGLAEGASTMAQHGLISRPVTIPVEQNIEWAKVSISVYEWLAKRTPDYHSFELKTMGLRAFLISRCGIQPNHPVLDVQILLNWFWQRLPMSLPEAMKKSSYIKSMLATGEAKNKLSEHDISELIQLRRVKNRLGPIRLLVEEGMVIPDDELKSWLANFANLP